MSRLKDKLTSLLITQLPEFLRGDDTVYSVSTVGSTVSGSNAVIYVNSFINDGIRAGDLVTASTLPASTYVEVFKTGGRVIVSNNATTTANVIPITFTRTNTETRFTKFLEAYYDFMQQDEGAQEVIQNAKLYSDIDSTSSNLINNFFLTYGPELPRNPLIDKKVFIKRFRDLYKSKGSEQAYEFLFRTMFGQDVNFHYPEQLVMKPSDGKWRTKQIMRVVQDGTVSPLLFKNSTITGNSSGSTAVVNDALHIEQYGLNIYELELEPKSVKGVFFLNEQIKTRKLSNTITGTYSNVFGNVLSLIKSITVNDGGLGYTLDTDVIINPDPGNGAIAKISEVDSLGSIKKVDVIEYGVNYANNDAKAYFGFCNNSTDTTTFLNDIYSYYYQRTPDYAGFTYWYNLIQNNTISRCALEQQYFANSFEGVAVTVSDPTIEIAGNVNIQNTVSVARLVSNHGLTTGKLANLKFIGNLTLVSGFDASNTLIKGDSNLYSIDATIFTSTSNVLNNTNTIVYVSYLPSGKSIRFPTGNISLVSNIIGNYTYANIEARLGYLNEASLTAEVSTIGETAGFWSNEDSILDTKYLRGRALFSDGAQYYQPFSYVVKSNVLNKDWVEIAKDTVHPAGLAVFGEYQVRDFANVDVSKGLTANSNSDEVWDYFALTADMDEVFTSDMTTYTSNSITTSILVGNVATIFRYL